jgi:hypothetical protein
MKIFGFLILDYNRVRGAILGTDAEVDTGACPTAGTPLGTGAPDSTAAAVLGPVESGTGVRAV